MGLALIILAAGYGAAGGLLLPRAAYRLSVEPERPWRDRCPEGHPLPGWVGLARCPAGAGGPVPARRALPEPAPPPLPEPAPPPGPGTAPVPGRPAGSGGTSPARPHPYGPSSARTAALTGGVCAALAAACGPRPEAAVFVVLAPALVLLGLVDLAVHRLPDPLTLPLAALTAALLGGAALLPGAAGSWRLALLGGLALGGAYLVLFLINPAGMGFGDVKLALSLGVALGWYGWGVWFAGTFLGFLYGAVYGLALVLRRRGGPGAAFAFGPFMTAGALTGMLLGGFGA
ncbi:A24 family peptidase [Streptomyces sp. A1136]|uniref:prepilin peptidase n=1 Tax=Streptomyces sp. A1136 TaxID=2563102 RepID=UPI00109E64E9|nr:A24 family peptidase [Streptomyces sp. A1136]THA49543.1 prepilin peptidase [Streptomyces sp. A1136]